jgi:large subunit ribosomal protein L28
MAKICDICGKQPSVGHAISHAHNLTKRRWLPNLQRVRALVDGRVKHINVCAKCLKAGKVQKAPHKVRVKAPVELVTAPTIEMPTEPMPVLEMSSAV